MKLVENNRNIASIYYSLDDYDRLLVYLKKDKADSYSNIYYGLMYDAGLKFKKDSKKPFIILSGQIIMVFMSLLQKAYWVIIKMIPTLWIRKTCLLVELCPTTRLGY
ncbi:hypothetical protein KUH03_04280 [Sphingobacterium sp. E70]|uniref:hypothetical protein n=1 Tax=Sphingobacterium sp. E70 TaxID=2853439 RepID=UPI00211BC5F6|nr:hypothetical protein [Sphingobacterium sp. E70]ULT26159.1 hypothetical protein KUH03_04280 [Sphingobacterium sp. E70]